MTEVIALGYLQALLGGQSGVPQARSDRLRVLRGRALERANALSVPSLRDEEWRFTDISPLLRIDFKQSRTTPVVSESDIAAFDVPEACARLVFCDGHWMPALSRMSGLPDGITVSNFSSLPLALSAQSEATLGTLASFEQEPFCALNTAMLHDGALIRAATGTECAAPIHLLFVTTQKETACHPRVLVIAERGARVSFIEDFVSLGSDSAFVNAVTEVQVAENAEVSHVKLQRLTDNQFHFQTLSATLARDARLQSRSMTFGARVSRHNLLLRQIGENMNCEIDGLALISGRQLADTHSSIDHAVPNGRSTQVHKCIVNGAARAVFNGKILVRKGAQRTDSSQQSRNLLLSERARVDTKPQLEILADDVKCAHGATVGQLDAEEIFYLRSRGLTLDAARGMLTYAFAAELIERLSVPSLVMKLEKYVLDHTAHATKS